MRLPTCFISHGGGLWPWLKDEMRGADDQLEASLQDRRHHDFELPLRRSGGRFTGAPGMTNPPGAATID